LSASYFSLRHKRFLHAAIQFNGLYKAGNLVPHLVAEALGNLQSAGGNLLPGDAVSDWANRAFRPRHRERDVAGNGREPVAASGEPIQFDPIMP